MKTLSIILISIFLCHSTAFAQTSYGTRLNIPELTKSAPTPAAKSEIMANAAERMFILNPATFMFVDEIMAQALVLNSANKKASYYLSMLSFLKPLKGILSRSLVFMKDVQGLSATERVRYFTHHPSFSSLPPQVIKYMLEPATSFKSGADLQATIDSSTALMARFRTSLNQYLGLTITINSVAGGSRGDCSAVKIADLTYSFSKCLDKGILARVTLNNADLSALSKQFGIVHAALLTVGLRDITNAQLLLNFPSSKQNVRDIFKVPQLQNLLQVRNLNDSRAVYPMVLDGLSAMISGSNTLIGPWKMGAAATAKFTELSKSARKQTIPFKYFDMKAYEAMINRMNERNKVWEALVQKSTDLAQKNQSYRVEHSSAVHNFLYQKMYGGEQYNYDQLVRHTPINYRSFFDNPTRHFSDLGAKFDAGGRVSTVTNKTLNGMLPEGTLMKIFGKE